jgi:flagellar protein FliO/FliZ
MMFWYILKLVFIVPIVGALAYGSLWLWRRVQPGMAFNQRARLVKLVDAIPLGATGKMLKNRLREQYGEHLLAKP